MSTYWYLECLDHDPPLRSADEVEQHTYGLDRVRRLVATREHVLAGLSSGFEATDYFDRHTVAFIRDHPHCPYRLISEYGDTEELPSTLARSPQGATEAPTAHEHPSDTPEGLDGRTVGELTETETGEP